MDLECSSAVIPVFDAPEELGRVRAGGRRGRHRKQANPRRETGHIVVTRGQPQAWRGTVCGSCAIRNLRGTCL